MPIKSILLHMANDDRHRARLEVAASLARRFGAFLEVLYVATPAHMPAAVTGRGASYGFIAEATAIAHEKAEQVEREIATVLADVPHSWQVVEGDHVELLAARASFADLAVITQSHGGDDDGRVLLHVPDRLPLASACPALVLPHAMEPGPFGTHAVVAWKNTREAVRAVRAALPFLKEAGKVTVLTIGAEATEGRDLMAYLERHGVRAQCQNVADGGSDVGGVMLDMVRAVNADMLVMGAYGHSRFREMVLGGATRTVLQHLHVPALMAH